MIHKDLCLANNTKYWTRNQIKLHMYFSKVHTWNGIIPLSLDEIARENNITIQTLNSLLIKAQEDGIIKMDGRRIKFLKVASGKEPYVAHFPFIDSNEFLSEDIRVIRFVLHMLAHGVYSGYIFNMAFSKLHHRLNKKGELVSEGLFNIYRPAKLRDVLKKSKKYLCFSEKNEGIVRVLDIHPHLKNEVIKNNGEHLYVRSLFNQFDLLDIKKETISEIVKVRSTYKENLGLEAYNEICDEAFSRAISAAGPFISRCIENEARQVGLYYREVCEEVEREFLHSLVKRKKNTQRAIYFMKKLSNSSIVKKLGRNRYKIKDSLSKLSHRLQGLLEMLSTFDQYMVEMLNLKYKSSAERYSRYLQHITELNIMDPEALPIISKAVQSTLKKKEPEPAINFSFYNWITQEKITFE